MKLSKLLLEGFIIYKIDVLIKSKKTVNQVYIYNEIRGLKDVVVVNVVQNDYLKSQSTKDYHYALLNIKYLVRSSPEETINFIKKDALVTSRIDGLLQFVPRFKTIIKIGEY